MELGYTVGGEYRRLADVPDRFAFAELAVGEGDLPLSRLDVNAVRSRLPDGVALTVHLPFRQPLATGVPELDRAVREYVGRAIDAAVAAGADAGVCHVTARDPTDERQREALVESMRTLTEAGAECGFAVHFENVGQVRTGASLGAVADLAAAADASLCFDVGHAHVETDEETIAAFVREAGERIDYLHVHDVRARGDSHIPVGAGEVDFAWLAELLCEVGFDDRAAVEVFTDDAAHMLDSGERFAAAVDDYSRR